MIENVFDTPLDQFNPSIKPTFREAPHQRIHLDICVFADGMYGVSVGIGVTLKSIDSKDTVFRRDTAHHVRETHERSTTIYPHFQDVPGHFPERLLT
jgi:hypothetical protein